MTEKRIIKTYLCTNTLETNWPPEFVSATGKKFIVVRYCVATIGEDGYQPYDLALHADFVERDAYLDHFVDVVNVIDNGSKPSKYEISENHKKSFKVWFTTLDGTPIDLPIDFVLKLLLIYES
ncbi:MAG: hypothetical protein IKN65_06010 [Clostridia bacterium]|nr:hypothetical protein [Clostridia bacterium]